MASDDDDILDGPIPEPDAKPSPAEQMRAKSFADLVDKTLAGRTPPALSADERALLEVATVIRAASGNIELGAVKRRNLVEDALRQAVGGVSPAASLAGAAQVIPMKRRVAPWIVAGVSTAVALAAVMLLWLRPAKRVEVEGAGAAAALKLPMEMRSRPADALIGKIDRANAADASTRIDTIFADRLDGYRAEIYGGWK